MSEYTPTTEEMRERFILGALRRRDVDREAADWDAWLASVKAEAWDEGWMHDADYVNTWGQFCPHKECNPYREPRQTPE